MRGTPGMVRRRARRARRPVAGTAPGRGRRTGAALAAALLFSCFAALLIASPAGAALYTGFDFESPIYGGVQRRITDHYLLKFGGVWHLFYTELPGPVNPVCRIGHATSPDLSHWTEHATVLTAGGAPWMSSGVWAPHVASGLGGGWVLLFSGASDERSQVIAALTSSDLEFWQPYPGNPVFTPDTAWALWSPSIDSSCRDPFLYYENGSWRMLYTARTVEDQPAIGWAESLDLLTWTDRGPFAVDSLNVGGIDLESPGLYFDNNRVELLYTRVNARILTAATSAGPWNIPQGALLDASGSAAERVNDGAVRLLSRVRHDDCSEPTTIVVIDTVTATPSGYLVPGAPALPAGWTISGDAFLEQPTFGDPAAHRSDVSEDPTGFRWLASGEVYRLPGLGFPCVAAERWERTGEARTPAFVLQGDSLIFRLMGAASPDSAYLALEDECTGLTIARQTGPGGNGLVGGGWSNAGRRGWSVRLRLVDRLDRPGGVIGLDAVRDTAAGSPVALAPPQVAVTAPAGGENLSPGSHYTIRWTASDPSGLDSNEVYVSYDNFATAPTKLATRTGGQTSFQWTVPSGPSFGVRVRVVTYAQSGVHACSTSNAFDIAAVVDVPAGESNATGGLDLSVFGSPGPRPGLALSTPPGSETVLALYDLRGRRVRELYRGSGGVRRVTWDGLDGAGRPAAPGLYFALLSARGEVRSAPVVRLAR